MRDMSRDLLDDKVNVGIVEIDKEGNEKERSTCCYEPYTQNLQVRVPHRR